MPVYILLSDTRAVDVLHEITKEGTSDNPVARAVVDKEFGIASIQTLRPQDSFEERVLRLDTPRSAKPIITVLSGVKGVAKAAPVYEALLPNNGYDTFSL